MSQIIISNARVPHQIERCGAVLHGDDAMAGVAQRLARQQLDVGLVVDQQDIETVPDDDEMLCARNYGVVRTVHTARPVSSS